MPELPTVACVIPTHRRPALLEEAVHSALAQTYAASEILVVADEPSPGERERMEALAAQTGAPLRYLAHADGRGPSTSRNAGAHAASAEWLAFLDDDDRWLPDYLRVALAGAARADLILCARWDFRGESPRTAGKTPLPAYDERAFLRRNPGGAASTLLIRRTLFLAVGGFDPRLGVSEDRDLVLRAMRGGGRYAAVSERLVEHREHAVRLRRDLLRLLPARARFVAKHARHMRPSDFAYTLRKTARELWRADWRRRG